MIKVLIESAMHHGIEKEADLNAWLHRATLPFQSHNAMHFRSTINLINLMMINWHLLTFTMLQTERDGFAVEFGLQNNENIVNVRNHVALPLMHED